MKIYHYTKYDTFIDKILPNKQLKFGDFKETNDPSEFIRYCNIAELNVPPKRREQFKQSFFKEIFTYKPLCFSMDSEKQEGWQLPCMWAHYGNNHKDICIELELERLPKTNIKHDAIHYSDSFKLSSFENKSEDFDEKTVIDDYIIENSKQLFFSKQRDWEIEQEYRFISKSEEFLDITNAITAVYMGVRNSWDSSRAIKLYERLEHESIELFFLEPKIENDEFRFNSTELYSYIYVRNKNIEILERMRNERKK